MKLSEMSTDRVCDVLCEITPYVANIVSDDELLNELRRAIAKDESTTGAEMIAMGVDKVTKLIPILMKKRRLDVFGIVGAVNGKTVEEISAQNFFVTAAQIREIIRDREMLDFFKSCAGMEGSE